jgi:hypothetical protein
LFSAAVRIGIALAGIRIAEHTHHFPIGLFGLAFVVVSTVPSWHQPFIQTMRNRQTKRITKIAIRISAERGVWNAERESALEL